MAQMNQTQVRYAKQRADQIQSEKISAIRPKFTVEQKRLTPDERVAAIKTGKFKVKKNATGAYYINDIIEFEGETLGYFDNDGYTKAVKPIMVAYHKLMDELILGDNEEALKLLKAFEAN